MFRCQAPALCDGWLGLRNYDDKRFSSKIQWVDSQADQLITANEQVMRNIKVAEARNKSIHRGKDMDIPVGNLVLLRDHPEGRCEIQDWNKSELFKVIRKGERPNNFWITPVGSKGLPKQVNQRQLFDTGTSEEGLAGGEENEEEEEEQGPAIPHYNPKFKPVSPISQKER